MLDKVFTNNQVTIAGEVVSDFTFSHEIYGENFFLVNIAVSRLSDSCDIIPVMVSDRLMDVKGDYKGCILQASGQFRSYNRHEETKNRLVLSVFAREVSFVEIPEGEQNPNHIFLDGYVCKKPVYRKTPLGREIADVLLAVNRPYGKSDYIPCICWEEMQDMQTSLKLVHMFSSGAGFKAGNIRKRLMRKFMKRGLHMRCQ